MQSFNSLVREFDRSSLLQSTAAVIDDRSGLAGSPLWNLPSVCTRQSLAERSLAASGSGNVLTSRSADVTDWGKGSSRLLRSGGSTLPTSRPNWLDAPAFVVWLIY